MMSSKQVLTRACSERMTMHRAFACCHQSLARWSLISDYFYNGRASGRRVDNLLPHQRRHSIRASGSKAVNLINPAIDPFIKIWDVKHVRFAAPHLDVMEEFCIDFGMKVQSKDHNWPRTRSFGSHVRTKSSPLQIPSPLFPKCSKLHTT